MYPSGQNLLQDTKIGDGPIDLFQIESLEVFSISVDSLATAVPEPATWSMMLVGCGVVGATARYRRRRTTAVYA